MSTSTKSRPVTQVRSVRFLPDLASQGQAIAITTNGVTTNYWVDPIHHSWGTAAYRLEKASIDGDNAVYDVLLDNELSTCTCADFTFRQQACKHVLACQALLQAGKL